MAENTHRHAYDWWTDERNTELIELLHTEMGIEEIADRTGRSVNAIKAQCVNLLPPDLVVSQSSSVPRLRETSTCGCTCSRIGWSGRTG
ncbi:hypothetical protein ACQPW1_27535 [Nocardia sp. CA-128927]|uniref:hypothetical protein n=1 Tax=Nocardia sp. CA-128927 TaxID=3239975 RepID=UPI003D9716E5